MGRLIMTIVGGAIGFLVGGPMGASIGMTLGGMAGQALFGPTIEGPRLTDLKVTASTYGQAIPELYGTTRMGTNMVWSLGIKETKKKSGGGKGAPKQTTYHYSATFAMAMCRGPIDDVLRIWADGKIIYDASNAAARSSFSEGLQEHGVIWAIGTIFDAKKNPQVKFRVYRGTEDQLPDSLIEADRGVGNVSAMRGLAYIVFDDMQLEDFANRIPGITVEVSKQRVNVFPSTPITDTAEPDNPTGGISTWYPDWEGNRLVGSSGGRSKVADLTTMKVLVRSDIPYGPLIPYAGVLMTTRSSSNSARMYITDVGSLTDIGHIGNNGNVVQMLYKSGNELVEQYAANHTWWGFTSADYGGGHTPYLIAMSGFGALGVFNFGAGPPVFLGSVPWFPRGFVAAGPGRFLGWRHASAGLQINIWGLGEATFSDTPGGPYISAPYTQEGSLAQPFPGESFQPTNVLYDPTDDCLFCIGLMTGTVAMFKWNLATQSFKFRRKDVNYHIPPTSMAYSRIEGGTFGFIAVGYGSPTVAQEISLQTGEIVRDKQIDDQPWSPGTTGGWGTSQHWDDRSSSLVLWTNGSFRRVYFRDSAEDISLAGVVEDICTRTGVLTSADIDTSDLEGIGLSGYLLDRQTSARDCLKQLSTAYFFDGYESDYLLKFKKRGSGSLVTIPEDWITRDKDGNVLKETITQELEMPMRITVNYNDIERDYQAGSQTAKRNSSPIPTMLTAAETSLELPLVWSATQAKRCAEKLLKMAWANRFAYDFTLPWRYLKYDPTDVGQVVMDSGTTFLLRFDSLAIGADFSIQAKAISEKAAAYISTATGSSGLGVPFQVVTGDFTALPLILNVPLLRDIDYDASGNSWLYYSAGTTGTTFAGATVFASSAGVDYTPLGSIPADAISGKCMTLLPKTKSYEAIDEDTQLRVVLVNPDASLLESTTLEEMLNEDTNSAVIGGEVIQYRDAEQQEDTTWILTGILRARRGTNYAVNSHSLGERFVVLQPGDVLRTQRPPANYFITSTFKAVTRGQYVEDAAPYTYNLIPRDIMPYSPENVALVDDGTDCTLTMARRSRISNTMVDGDAPIAYREGSMTSAKIAYKVWANKGITDYQTTADPTFQGTFALFDVNGNEFPIEITFPLGAETRFLVQVYEVGFTDGTPKYVAFRRGAATDPWDATELY